MRPTRTRFVLIWSAEDRAIAQELQKVTGVRTVAGVIRAALRAHYRSVTRRRTVPAPAGVEA